MGIRAVWVRSIVSSPFEMLTTLKLFGPRCQQRPGVGGFGRGNGSSAYVVLVTV